jgi:hypothetical protein
MGERDDQGDNGDHDCDAGDSDQDRSTDLIATPQRHALIMPDPA